jgi:SAM-dependent methyltransferase
MTETWKWDETLFRGSAQYYLRGRPPYSQHLPERLAELFGLDGAGRLIDVGCGPGIITLALAHLFEEVVGVDPDPDMLAEAQRGAERAGISNIRLIQSHAERLTPDFGPFRLATFGRSFHWMDRPKVAALMFAMLTPGGGFVHLSSGSHDEPGATTDLAYPVPPLTAISDLVKEYLGPERRAGQGIRGDSSYDLDEVMTEAGFVGHESVRVPVDGVLIRTTDDLVAFVFSRSGSAPHLFGDRLPKFESDLRRLLNDTSPSGKFAEQAPDTRLDIWRKP